jgi:hypothetical protein
MLSTNAPARVRKAELKAEALRLRTEGKTFVEIGQAIGRSKASAVKYVQQALAELNETTLSRTEELRALTAARLDALWSALLPQAAKGDVKAAAALVGVLARICKLYGLDSAVKIDVKARAGFAKSVQDMTDAELREYARRAGLRIDGVDLGGPPATVDSSRRPPLTTAQAVQLAGQETTNQETR